MPNDSMLSVTITHANQVGLIGLSYDRAIVSHSTPVAALCVISRPHLRERQFFASENSIPGIPDPLVIAVFIRPVYVSPGKRDALV